MGSMDKNNDKVISGFSKLSKAGKIKWLAENFFSDPKKVHDVLEDYWHSNKEQQEVLDGFSENTISNFPMPYGVAPNFVIDGKTYAVPMVIEESSVVAAASSAAKFWMSRGGFKTKIIGTKKIGQLHFKFNGDTPTLQDLMPDLTAFLKAGTADLTKNMIKRGGGISSIDLVDFSDREPYYYQLKVSFETCDSMGANFINSILEQFGILLKEFLLTRSELKEDEKDVEVIMAILSNFTPECLVRAEVSCRVEELGIFPVGISSADFAEKFSLAVRIAHLDPYRATTHNKGIFNGVDAVVLATGNDFRAIEACGHAYASLDGHYKSLSHCKVEHGVFKFWIDLPLAVGTVGGLTSLHPIAKTSLEMLGKPTAKELMSIITSVGLAQNFAALRSLVTTGIQQGHMKMHLQNILTHMKATKSQTNVAIEYFKDKTVSYSGVREFLDKVE
ncbi:MAG: hydroxymethylglutaryl-CoA reductase, degradative [Saprospiraceae bacterium]|nr:hydroxymethylglutaryl-CoA reductase, degradative [Saprospiraceae bacterium]